MLLDNSKDKKVFHELTKITENGVFKGITAYYTIHLLQQLLPKFQTLKELKLILGEITDKNIRNLTHQQEENQDSIAKFPSFFMNLKEGFTFLRQIQPLIEFLERENVEIKTLNPEFCHAKLYLFEDEHERRNSFAISGSSNLTGSGMGIYPSNNIELNHLFDSSGSLNYQELNEWFELQWHKSKDNKVEQLEFIKNYFKQFYTPKEVYLLTLYHVFGLNKKELFNDIQSLVDETTTNTEQEEKKEKHWKNTTIYQSLYEWQQKAVISLIQKIEKHGMAMLADGVGLGKTWQALAVIKYYESRGLSVLVISPKNLVENWDIYSPNKSNQQNKKTKKYTISNNKFKADKFSYVTVSITQLEKEINEEEHALDEYDLIVIDESHQLRNKKSKKYQFLLEKIIQSGVKSKLLLLTATPINNKIEDLQTQLYLGFHDNDAAKQGHFKNHFNDSLEKLFVKTQKAINVALKSEMKPSELTNIIGHNLQSVFQELIVSRTKKTIQRFYPETELKVPVVAYQSCYIEDFEIFIEELFGDLNSKKKTSKPKINFTIYKPSKYLDAQTREEFKSGSVTENNELRETFLAKMMLTNLVKRLESSVYAFNITFSRMIAYHELILALHDKHKQAKEVLELKQKEEKNRSLFAKIDDGFKAFRKAFNHGEAVETDNEGRSFFGSDDTEIMEGFDDINDADDENNDSKKEEYKQFLSNSHKKIQEQLNQPAEKLAKGYEIGVNNPISSNEMSSYSAYINNVRKDLERFKAIQTALKKHISNELNQDNKLKKLFELLHNALRDNPNRKILIFTTYSDTANYLHHEIIRQNESADLNIDVTKMEKIDGKTANAKKKDKILQRFSPYAKLWNQMPPHEQQKYQGFDDFWQQYLNDNKTSEVQILIATDCISEGQNLQDCDLLINYDIHWNPVRLVQRNGRIDRIGSNHEKVNIINFWPGKSLDDVLQLKEKIDYKMALVSVGGVDGVFDEKDKNIKEILAKETLSFKDEECLKQMALSPDELQDLQRKELFEGAEQSGSFQLENISLEPFKHDLYHFFSHQKRNTLKDYPTPVFSGIIQNLGIHYPKKGLIFTLRRQTPLKGFEDVSLHFIDFNGQEHYPTTAKNQILTYFNQVVRHLNADLEKEPKNEFILTEELCDKYQALIEISINNLKTMYASQEQSTNKTVKKLSLGVQSFSGFDNDYQLLTLFVIM